MRFLGMSLSQPQILGPRDSRCIFLSLPYYVFAQPSTFTNIFPVNVLFLSTLIWLNMCENVESHCCVFHPRVFVCISVHVYLRDSVCFWCTHTLCLRMFLYTMGVLYFGRIHFCQEHTQSPQTISELGQESRGSRQAISLSLLKKMITVTCTTKSPDSGPRGVVWKGAVRWKGT